jgi:hypothetical protein
MDKNRTTLQRAFEIARSGNATTLLLFEGGRSKLGKTA